jgi:hypothetical protein
MKKVDLGRKDLSFFAAVKFNKVKDLLHNIQDEK